MTTIKELLGNTYLVVDKETTMKCPVGSNAASPHWHENRAVYQGYLDNHSLTIFKEKSCILEEGVAIKKSLTEYRILVGHNLKFDLLYMLRHKTLDKFFQNGGRIWDTQLAEHVLTGQQTKFATLDELSKKYGGTVKASGVTKAFEAGIGADAIPEAEIVPYLKDDLKNTEIVFLSQVDAAARLNLLPLIEGLMDSLAMTTYMEHHGMAVDLLYVRKHISELTKEVALFENSYQVLISAYLPKEDVAHVSNWNSVKQLSLVFFGGDVEDRMVKPVGTYKNGSVKTKLVPHKRKMKGLEVVPKTVGADPTRQHCYEVDEKVLYAIVEGRSKKASQVAECVLKLRECSKQLSTYFERLESLTMPSGLVHPSFQHAATATGRLSCANPNLQNQTSGPIKGAFVSRFSGGMLYDFDYAQLEIVALAHLSKDKKLIEDINSGKDIHSELFYDMYGILPHKDERKKFKRLTFGLVYGAGVNTLAANANVPTAVASHFVKAFYGRYPTIKEWHDSNLYKARTNRKYVGDKTKTGVPVGRYTHISETGRQYVYKEYESTYKPGFSSSFSPTELKNYPVQGFATGDVVPLMLGVLFRVWINMPDSERMLMLPVCTVHDSIVWDVAPDMFTKAEELIAQTMVKVSDVLKNVFGIVFEVDVKVGMSKGENWLVVKEVSTISAKEC